MIDHITIRVDDIERTRDFYIHTLVALEYEILADTVYDDGVRVVGFGKDGEGAIWFTNDVPVSGPLHIAWVANSIRAVDDFYTLAMQAGAVDNGAPGLRAEYGDNYYGAFVIDPDGNNIEAVFRS
jgi:catechol 2,3-dioxygenase-like lactoylglutathione lyase family enzyme